MTTPFDFNFHRDLEYLNFHFGTDDNLENPRVTYKVKVSKLEELIKGIAEP